MLGGQDAVARDVSALGADLRHASEDDIINLIREKKIKRLHHGGQVMRDLPAREDAIRATGENEVE